MNWSCNRAIRSGNDDRSIMDSESHLLLICFIYNQRSRPSINRSTGSNWSAPISYLIDYLFDESIQNWLFIQKSSRLTADVIYGQLFGRSRRWPQTDTSHFIRCPRTCGRVWLWKSLNHKVRLYLVRLNLRVEYISNKALERDEQEQTTKTDVLQEGSSQRSWVSSELAVDSQSLKHQFDVNTIQASTSVLAAEL